MTQSEMNLKYLKDIDDYKNAHTNDFKQVYFSPASVTPSRVQNAVPTNKPLKSVSGTHSIQTCASSAAQEGAEYFALNPVTNKCDIYSASHIKTTNSAPVILETVWQIELPASTSYVCLDIIGNFNAYDAKHQRLATILQSQNPTDKRAKAGKFKLVLLDNQSNRLQPIRIQSLKTGATFANINVKSVELTRNSAWAKENNIIRTMTNAEQQEGNKRVAIDKITATRALVSDDYRFKLALSVEESGKIMFVLQASTKDNRQIYKTNVDEKVGKLYYASTYPEHQFLKEVPGSMQTLQPGNYSTYQDVYPNLQANYNIKESDNCAKVCDEDAGCNAVYTVVDSVSKKTYCFVSKDKPTFNAKPVQSKMDSSYLQVKNPAIQSNNTEYAKATYVADAYSSEFKSYKPDGVIDSSFIPGPEGAPYVQDLRKKVVESTLGPITINNSNPIKPKKEGFSVSSALKKLDDAESSINRYISTQSDISNNRAYIANKVTTLNTVYSDMSNNNVKYDFTTKDEQGNPITNLVGIEKSSFEKALEKDNAIYTNEQQNLYTIAGLTMATLIVMAIII